VGPHLPHYAVDARYELLLLGKRVDAAEALRTGFVITSNPARPGVLGR